MPDLVIIIDQDQPLYDERPIERYCLPLYLVFYRLVLLGCSCYSTVLIFPESVPDYILFRVALCALFVIEVAFLTFFLLSLKVPKGRGLFQFSKQDFLHVILLSVRVLITIILGLIIWKAGLKIKFYVFACFTSLFVDLAMVSMPLLCYETQLMNREQLLKESRSRKKRPKMEINKTKTKDSLKLKLGFGVVLSIFCSILLMAEHKEGNYYDKVARIVFVAVAIAECIYYAVAVYRERPKNRQQVFAFELKMNGRLITRMMFLAFPMVFFPLVFDTTGILMLHFGTMSVPFERYLIEYAVGLSSRRLGLPKPPKRQ